MLENLRFWIPFLLNPAQSWKTCGFRLDFPSFFQLGASWEHS